MSAIEIEAFREDVDNLTEALLSVVVAQTDGLPTIDYSIIVSAAMANVACRIDTIGVDAAGNIIANALGTTGRLRRITASWK